MKNEEKSLKEISEKMKEKFTELCELGEKLDKDKFTMAITIKHENFGASCLMGTLGNISNAFAYLMVSEEDWDEVISQTVMKRADTNAKDVDRIRKIQEISKRVKDGSLEEMLKGLKEIVPLIKEIKEDADSGITVFGADEKSADVDSMIQKIMFNGSVGQA